MESTDEADLVRLYCEEQLSLVDIARRFGRGTALIRQCLEDRGVRIRTAWERHAARLGQLSNELNGRGIVCPPQRLRVAAGYKNKYGVRSNQDLWGLGVHRRDSLHTLVTRTEPYIRHPATSPRYVRRLGNC